MKLIGELQNSRGWKGFLDIMGRKPLFKQGQSRLAWALFRIPPGMETLPPLWERCSA